MVIIYDRDGDLDALREVLGDDRRSVVSFVDPGITLLQGHRASSEERLSSIQMGPWPRMDILLPFSIADHADSKDQRYDRLAHTISSFHPIISSSSSLFSFAVLG